MNVQVATDLLIASRVGKWDRGSIVSGSSNMPRGEHLEARLNWSGITNSREFTDMTSERISQTRSARHSFEPC
jgi:hypothetical protein